MSRPARVSFLSRISKTYHFRSTRRKRRRNSTPQSKPKPRPTKSLLCRGNRYTKKTRNTDRLGNPEAVFSYIAFTLCYRLPLRLLPHKKFLCPPRLGHDGFHEAFHANHVL